MTYKYISLGSPRLFLFLDSEHGLLGVANGKNMMNAEARLSVNGRNRQDLF